MIFDRDGFYEELGLRLKLARNKYEFTQEELAEQIGIPRSTYASYETSRVRVPADIVWRISIVFGIRVKDLLPPPKKPWGY